MWGESNSSFSRILLPRRRRTLGNIARGSTGACVSRAVMRGIPLSVRVRACACAAAAACQLSAAMQPTIPCARVVARRSPHMSCSPPRRVRTCAGARRCCRVNKAPQGYKESCFHRSVAPGCWRLLLRAQVCVGDAPAMAALEDGTSRCLRTLHTHRVINGFMIQGGDFVNVGLPLLAPRAPIGPPPPHPP